MKRLGLGLLPILFVGCGPVHKTADVSAQKNALALAELLEKPNRIDFPSIERLVFSTHCLECHSSARHENGVDLSNYEAVKAGEGGRRIVVPFNPDASLIHTTVVKTGERHMPPLGHPQLSSAQVQLLDQWIANGAKFEAGEDPKPELPIEAQIQAEFTHPENIDYETVKKFVLAETCMKCHSLNGAAPDRNAITYSANLTSYESLFNPFTPVINKGKPEESKLYQSTALTQTMPPVKGGYLPLDGLRLKLIRLWILNCAIESNAATGEEVLVNNPETPEKVRKCDGDF
jgi:hypothetical protein